MSEERKVQVLAGAHEIAAMNIVIVNNLKRNLQCTMSGAFKKSVIFYARVIQSGLEHEVTALVEQVEAERLRNPPPKSDFRPSDYRHITGNSVPLGSRAGDAPPDSLVPPGEEAV